MQGGAALVGAATFSFALRDHQPRLYAGRRASRWSALESDGHSGGLFPPGVADGPVSFVRAADGDCIVFQMHANGQTYRHKGPTLDAVGPGVWVIGSIGAEADGSGYQGICTVLRAGGPNRIFAWIHQEDHTLRDPIATIGQAFSDDEGYSWTHQGTILAGDGSQPTGFRGAELPSVARDGDRFVMLYGNRHGNGRYQQIHLATAERTADDTPGTWTKQGEVISEAAVAPHFFAAAPSLRWSKAWETWLCLYSTDSAYRYRTSSDLETWSAPRSVLTTKSLQQQQTVRQPKSGWIRWYPSLLDERQADSSIIGSRGRISEHRINVATPLERFPTWVAFWS